MTPMLIITHPPRRRAERTYIYSVIFREFLGIEYTAREKPGESTVLSFGDAGGRGTIVIPDSLFALPDRLWLTESSLPAVPLHYCRIDARFHQMLGHISLPVLYGAETDHGAPFYRIEDTITSAVDIFASIFFLLTRYEEAVTTQLDEHMRTSLARSAVVREGLTERALVNEYLELLWGMMAALWPRLQRKEREYRLLPTHDIDVPVWSSNVRPARLLRSITADLVIRRDTMLAMHRYRSAAGTGNGEHGLDPNNTYNFIMDCSEMAGSQSTFFVKAGRTSSFFDHETLLDSAWMRSLLRSIHERGHEIGLHPSYETFNNAPVLRRELRELHRICGEERIEQRQWGGRQHYLRWENPTTWQYYQDAGLAYDTSLSFIGAAGFRTGCCYEYPCFNLRTSAPLRLRERPLIVMDAYVFRHWAQPTKEAMEKIMRLASTCRTFRGDFVILWHNDSLISARQKEAYRTIIRSCR